MQLDRLVLLARLVIKVSLVFKDLLAQLVPREPTLLSLGQLDLPGLLELPVRQVLPQQFLALLDLRGLQDQLELLALQEQLQP